MRDVSLFLHNFPDLAPHLAASDFADESRVRSAVGLRSFLSGMTAPAPAWLRALFALRTPLAAMLSAPKALAFAPTPAACVPFSPGGRFGPFVVETAEDERLWLGVYESSALTARLAVAPEGLPCGERLYHLATIVRFKNTRGRLYMSLIRPFHALVCDRMARLGAWGSGAAEKAARCANPS